MTEEYRNLLKHLVQPHRFSIVYTVCAVCLLVMHVQVQAEDLDIATILESLRNNDLSITTGKVEYTMEITFFGQSMSDAELERTVEDRISKLARLVERRWKRPPDQGWLQEQKAQLRSDLIKAMKDSTFRKDSVFIFKGEKRWQEIRETVTAPVPEGSHVHKTVFAYDLAKSMVLDVPNRPSLTGEIFAGQAEKGLISRTHPLAFGRQWSKRIASSITPPKLLGREDIDGTQQYVLELGTGRVKLWVDPARGFLVTKAETFSAGGGIARQIILKGPVLHGDGIWFPTEAVVIHYRRDGRPNMRHRFIFTKVQFNIPVGDDTFELEFPSTTYVTDYRLEPPISYRVGATLDVEEAVLDALTPRGLQDSIGEQTPNEAKSKNDSPQLSNKEPEDKQLAALGTHTGTTASRKVSAYSWPIALLIALFAGFIAFLLIRRFARR